MDPAVEGVGRRLLWHGPPRRMTLLTWEPARGSDPLLDVVAGVSRRLGSVPTTPGEAKLGDSVAGCFHRGPGRSASLLARCQSRPG